MSSDYKEQIEKLDPEDFDGHTDFDKLTPEQKLAWLAAIAVLARTAKKV